MNDGTGTIARIRGRNQLSVRELFLATMLYGLMLPGITFAQDAAASTEIAQQQPLHQQPAPVQRYQYTDNDAYYQPYRPAGNPPQYYQAPAAPQPHTYTDNDTYYQQYKPAAGNNPTAQPQPAQPAPGNPPAAAPAPTYGDNDAAYNPSQHFYDPMYDY